MTLTISLKSGSRHCSIRRFASSALHGRLQFTFNPASSIRLQGVRYERLGDHLIATGTLEGPRLDISGRTDPRQHHTGLAPRAQRAFDNHRRNDRGSWLHRTPTALRRERYRTLSHRWMPNTERRYRNVRCRTSFVCTVADSKQNSVQRGTSVGSIGSLTGSFPPNFHPSKTRSAPQ
jgi:hypothetical protein